MANKLGVALSAVGLVGGAALALVAKGAPPKPRLDPQIVASELESRLRETAAGVHSRLTTLAELPRLQAAVSTDAATVRDLTTEELAFRPKPGETITIGQVPKAAGQSPVALITLPARAGDGPQADAARLAQTGARLTVSHDQLAIAEVTEVVPKARAEELSGALEVIWPVELGALDGKLRAAGAALRIEAGGRTAVVGRAGEPAAAATPLVLESALAKGARVLAAIPLEPAQGSPLRPGGAAVALLSLLGLALAVTRKRSLDAGQNAELAIGATQMAPPVVLSASPPGGPESKDELAGRYTILRKLGSGGMADVFLARARGAAGFEKQVALKVLHPVVAATPAFVEHFLDEARLASRLTHPNIVQIADLGQAGDAYFIAMEYIDGADLHGLMVRSRALGQPVPIKVALAIVRKICDGLHAAHTAVNAAGQPLDLIHRDVKGENVFVARNGQVKVGDFGIAKANLPEGAVKKTEIGMVKGTAAYMAPEHRTGQAIDRRADLYGVGAIAYELLTGQEVNLDLALLAEKGRAGWPHLPKPTEVRPELPPALDGIVLRCLAYDKADRFADCAALEEALEQLATQTQQLAGDKAIAQWVEGLLAASAANAG